MLIDLTVLLSTTYSYIALFLLVFASSIIVVPNISILVAFFATAIPTKTSLIYLVLLVLIASILGDLTVYFITIRFSNKVESWMKRLKWYQKDEGKFKAIITNYGFAAIIFSRFLITGADVAANYLAGFEKMNKNKFISAVIIGETISAMLYVFAGYIFKDTLTEFLNFIQSSLLAFVSFLILVVIAYRIKKHYTK